MRPAWASRGLACCAASWDAVMIATVKRSNADGNESAAVAAGDPPGFTVVGWKGWNGVPVRLSVKELESERLAEAPMFCFMIETSEDSDAARRSLRPYVPLVAPTTQVWLSGSQSYGRLITLRLSPIEEKTVTQAEVL